LKTITIATTNKKKKEELGKLLKGLRVKILTLSDVYVLVPTIIEDGKTFKQNAIKKAMTFSSYIKGLVLADDSGLVVDALDGRPGVRSARFARMGAKDEENNSKLLKLMETVPVRKRQATFVSACAIAREGVLLGTSEGECKGAIGFEPRGNNGFGYDPLFIPSGYKQTFAEFKPAFKNKISHRAKSLMKAREIIQRYL